MMQALVVAMVTIGTMSVLFYLLTGIRLIKIEERLARVEELLKNQAKGIGHDPY